jgi:hypothetical protein
MFDYLFSVSLTFFGVFCVLIGYLTFSVEVSSGNSWPADAGHWFHILDNSFKLFLALPSPYPPWVTHNEVGARGIGEIGLAWRRRRDYFGGAPCNRCLCAGIVGKD